MEFKVDIETARKLYPEFKFVKALTPSAQKAAFLVQDKDGQPLCFKIINPASDIDRVGREIQALTLLSHKNVVRLIQYKNEVIAGSTKHFMIEEFIDGVDLEAKLADNFKWDAEFVAAIFIELCDGLTALHEKSIVHRDLKPANIRLRKGTDSPVIIDFGLARLLTQPDLTKTSDGAQLGTRLYFAPEQWRGTKYDIDHRTDLFALGLMMFKALTGEHAFLIGPTMTVDALEESVCSSEAPFNNANFKKLAPKWQLILKKLLEKQRGRRPNTAAQVAQLLRPLGGL